MQQQALMAGVYFKANEEIRTLDEYEGEKGMFVETFAINDIRNKNGWRATWEGIKKYLSTFKGKPGIEFIKCEADGCDLDHTEAQTEELSLQVQEPYRQTTIIGTKLDEQTHTGYFVHKVHDREFFEKLRRKEIKGVSPSIWPKAGGFEIIGYEGARPLIDVWEWSGLHDAFVNKPAFGDEARITAICEGDNCPVKLLSAKEKTVQLTADAIQDCVTRKVKEWAEKPSDQKLAIFYSECRRQLNSIVDNADMQHLQEIPLLVPHNKKKRFFTVSKTVYSKVAKILEDGGGVDESRLFEIIRKEDENNSFKSCTCSANHMPPVSEDEHEKLKAKLTAQEEEKKELESKLAAQEEEEKKEYKARVARYSAIFKAQTEEEKEKLKATIKATEDEKEIKAMEEAEKDKPAKSAQEDEEKEEMKASMKAMEAKLAAPLIEKMVKARTLKGATNDDIEEFKKEYSGKSLSAVEADYNKEKIFIEQELSAAEQDESPSQKHFAFQGADGVTSQFSAKSLEDVFEEAEA